jgi:hypothetical protein
MESLLQRVLRPLDHLCEMQGVGLHHQFSARIQSLQSGSGILDHTVHKKQSPQEMVRLFVWLVASC